MLRDTSSFAFVEVALKIPFHHTLTEQLNEKTHKKKQANLDGARIKKGNESNNHSRILEKVRENNARVACMQQSYFGRNVFEEKNRLKCI